jgi:dihydroorotate dehydrogenase (fumarate)
VTELSTTYLGLPLSSPLIASAGPMTGDRDMWARLEAAGAGAIVLPSLFEEEIEATSPPPTSVAPTCSPSRSPTSRPRRHRGRTGQTPRARRGRTRCVDIPIIASINGTSPGGWVRYARALESAGASAIELNVYDVVIDPRSTAADVEHRLLELVEEVRSEVSVPLA